MLFTDFQKEIIQSISNNDVNNYYTMAKALFKDFKGSNPAIKISTYKVEEKDLPTVHKKLLDYYYVCKILESKELIQIIGAGEEASGLLHVIIPRMPDEFQSKQKVDEVSFNIVGDFRNKIIIPSNELKQFIENDYKTKEELYQDRLIYQQEKSMAFTRRIALGSIIISMLSLVASIFLASNRKVEITNPGAFSNKMNVIIENDTKYPTK